MIEIAKAHSVAAAIELPAFELPDVQNIYMTSLPVAQALQPEVFSFWDRDAVIRTAGFSGTTACSHCREPIAEVLQLLVQSEVLRPSWPGEVFPTVPKRETTCSFRYTLHLTAHTLHH